MNSERVAAMPAFGATEVKSVATRLLIFVSFVNLLHTMDRQVINALLEPIRHDLNLSDSQLGFIAGLAYSIASGLIAIPAGMLVDRVSRKAVLTLAVTIWSGATAMCGLVGSYGMLALSRMAVGGAEAAGPISALSMIADAYPKERRAGATGTFYAAGGFGTLLAFSAGSAIAQHYGWRMAFFLASVPAVILVPLLLMFLIEPARTGSLDTPKKLSLLSAFAALGKDPRLALLLIGSTMSNLGPVALVGWATSLLVRNHGLQLSQAGLVVAAASGIGMPLGQYVGGWFGDKLALKNAGAPIVFAGVTVIAGAVLGAIAALSPSTPVTVVALFAATFCMILNLAPTWALLMHLAPADARATIFSFLSVLGNLLSWGGGPLVVGTLSDLIGGPRSLPYAIAIAMSLSLIPASIFGILARRLRRGTATP